MSNDTTLPFTFQAVGSKKITTTFDGGPISSVGGVMLLAQAERKLNPSSTCAVEGAISQWGIDPHGSFRSGR